ncbi:Bifunctional protein FolD 2 [Sesamum alatum]|uniref:Bifunctional protein FolD 2 n=1 Tax=Sesamum alatum TaxID=300844 RepID=A0AAE1Z4G2_9LAMI|nr:Bifunctional protein FolD 2 [Sesamum alatum]
MSDHKATLIDGKAIAQTIRSEIAAEVRRLSQTYGKVPGLAVVIVGKRKDSQSYVNMKRKACAEVGIKSFDLDLPEEVSESDLISKVHELNGNPDVHGILVQLPLPKHINEEKILSEISLNKDVDGFHPLNIGKLAMKGRDPLFVPCTPKGCIELLSRSGVSIKGKNAVVVGRSNIVGLPVSLLLLKEDATVTIVHSRTKEPESIIRNADIVIAAAGQAMMIKGSWIKPGAAVIDVGTNAVDDPSKKSGYRLVGDVDFQEACKVAGWITPVPEVKALEKNNGEIFSSRPPPHSRRVFSFSRTANAGDDFNWMPMNKPATCQGSIAECMADGGDFDMDSEINRRILATTNYISYGALQANNVPCSQRAPRTTLSNQVLQLIPTLGHATAAHTVARG